MLKHVPGKSMGKADGLSRRSNWQEIQLAGGSGKGQ